MCDTNGQSAKAAQSLPRVKSRGREARGVAPLLYSLSKLRARRKKRPSKQVMVAVNCLGRGMEHHVTAQLERALAAWRGNGVVGNCLCAVVSRQCCELCNVNQSKQWIAWAFNPKQIRSPR